MICILFFKLKYTVSSEDITTCIQKAVTFTVHCTHMPYQLYKFPSFFEHCALFLVNILPSSSETLLLSALPPPSAPCCHCASALWEICQPCSDQDQEYEESAWLDCLKPGKHHISWLEKRNDVSAWHFTKWCECNEIVFGKFSREYLAPYLHVKHSIKKLPSSLKMSKANKVVMKCLVFCS